MKSGSNLERVLAAGQFAVTAELGPPMGCDPDAVRRKAALLRGSADAINLTDCQTAVVRLSSIASAVLLLEEGIEPVMQMTTRDRNRIAIQADILGACALGVRNCLCIAGDHQSFGAAGKLKGHPGSKNVYDVDSIQLVSILKGMRDDRRLQGGDPVDPPPRLFIGAAWTPLADPQEFRVLRLAKKAAAGADFIQTQGVYDVEQFADAMAKARAKGLHEKTAILAGIIVPKNAGMLRYMNASVPGVKVPDAMLKRFPAVKKDAPAAEKEEVRRKSEEIGKQITVELIQEVRRIEGVRGVHIQAIEWESAVPEIIKAAGLLPRPAVSAPAEAGRLIDVSR
jgi:methylenetetrahydrofolate reductase (NADPH)